MVFKKGHKINLGRKRLDMIGNKFKKGIPAWNKGKTGFNPTPASFKKGMIPWNKGLTKSDPRVKINSENTHKTMRENNLYGHNKGIKSIKKSESKLREKNPAWKGGIRKHYRGYIYVLCKDHPNANAGGYVFEHRLVVEAFIGRYLNTKEVIHHIDLNKKNNKIENLMLFENDSKHQSFHQKIRQFGMTNPIRRQIENRWNEYK